MAAQKTAPATSVSTQQTATTGPATLPAMKQSQVTTPTAALPVTKTVQFAAAKPSPMAMPKAMPMPPVPPPPVPPPSMPPTFGRLSMPVFTPMGGGGAPVPYFTPGRTTYYPHVPVPHVGGIQNPGTQWEIPYTGGTNLSIHH